MAASVFTSIMWIHWVSKFSGFSPYGIVVEEDRIRISTRWYHFVPTALVYVCLGYCLHLSSINEEVIAKSNIKFIFIAKMVLFRSSIVLLMVVMAWLYLRRETMAFTINKLHFFDRKIEEISGGTDTSEELQLLKNIIYLSILNCLAMMVVSYFILRDHDDIRHAGSQILLVVLNYVGFGPMNFRFMSSLMGLHRRFLVLNQAFRLHFRTERHGHPTLKLSRKDTQRMVFRIAVLHDHLVDVLEIINRNFALQMLSSIYAFIGIATLNSFTYYAAFVKSDVQALKTSTFVMMWVVYFGLVMLLIIYQGSRTTNEGRKIVHLVSKSWPYSDDPDLLEQMRLLVLQVQQRNPVVQANAILVNWPLYLSMWGTCITYLVVFIQFENSGKIK